MILRESNQSRDFVGCVQKYWSATISVTCGNENMENVAVLIVYKLLSVTRYCQKRSKQ
jgi:hypothetical protein